MSNDENNNKPARPPRDASYPDPEACMIENHLYFCDDAGTRYRRQRLEKLKELTGIMPTPHSPRNVGAGYRLLRVGGGVRYRVHAFAHCISPFAEFRDFDLMLARTGRQGCAKQFNGRQPWCNHSRSRLQST